MRRKCSCNQLLFRSAFLLIVFFLCIHLPAQDSVQAGIIHVHRPPVPAVYQVRVQYLFPPNSVRKSRQANVEGTAIIFNDSMNNVVKPQPFFFGGDSSMHDAIIKELQSVQYMADTGIWSRFSSTIGHSFSRMDSSRIDSCRLYISIKRSGEFSISAMPFQNSDSTALVLQSKSLRSAKQYLYWTPARLKSRKKRKRKKIDSTVILTIYAMDPTYGKFMPIEDKVR